MSQRKWGFEPINPNKTNEQLAQEFCFIIQEAHPRDIRRMFETVLEHTKDKNHLILRLSKVFGLEHVN